MGLKEKYWNLLNVEGGGGLGYGYFLELYSIFFVPVVLQKGRFLMDSNAKIM